MGPGDRPSRPATRLTGRPKRGGLGPHRGGRPRVHHRGVHPRGGRAGFDPTPPLGRRGGDRVWGGVVRVRPWDWGSCVAPPGRPRGVPFTLPGAPLVNRRPVRHAGGGGQFGCSPRSLHQSGGLLRGGVAPPHPGGGDESGRPPPRGWPREDRRRRPWNDPVGSTHQRVQNGPFPCGLVGSPGCTPGSFGPPDPLPWCGPTRWTSRLRCTPATAGPPNEPGTTT